MQSNFVPWRMRVIGAGLVCAAFAQSLFAVPAPTPTGPGIDPADFRVTVFAEGLNFPFGMQILPDGSLIAATHVSGSFFAGQSQILRFVDADDDGVADGPGQAVYGNGVGIGGNTLNGPLTTIRQIGDLLITIGASGPITVLREPATPGDPYTYVGQIDIATDGGQHTPSSIAVRQTPAGGGSVVANSYDIVFQYGATNNSTASVTGGTVNGLGIVNQPIARDSLHMLTIVDSGGTNVTASNLTQIATGLRNAAGQFFHPVTGDLWFQDNGIDGLINANNPESADELNRILAANVGTTVPNFGFPNNYVKYDLVNSNNVEICNGGTNTAACDGIYIDPLVTFQPVNPPNGARSEGPSEIALAPALFPAGLNNGIFVTFHGRNNTTGVANIENPLVYVDLTDFSYFHFLANTEAFIGHIDAIWTTNDSIFIADLSSQGTLGSAGAGSGVIYQIKVIVPTSDDGGDDTGDDTGDDSGTTGSGGGVPEPATVMLSTLAMAMLVRRRTR